MTDAPHLPLCEICGDPVDQRATGKTVNSNGRYWHGTCYKAQERIDRSEAAWAECVERLNTRADAQCVEVKPLVFWESDTGDLCCDSLLGRYQIQKDGERWCCMYAMGSRLKSEGIDVPTCHHSEASALAAAQAHHAAQITAAINTRDAAEVRAEERERVTAVHMVFYVDKHGDAARRIFKTSDERSEFCNHLRAHGLTQTSLEDHAFSGLSATIRSLGEGE